MRVVPRSWYFHYGRVRLYRRLVACGCGLAVAAGIFALGFLQVHPLDSVPDWAWWAFPREIGGQHPVSGPLPSPGYRTGQRNGAVWFRNCAAARAAGKAPIHQGEPGYSPHLDRDGDGVACEPWSARPAARR
jgi:hypothetical protein